MTGDEDWKPWAVFFPNDSAESKGARSLRAQLRRSCLTAPLRAHSPRCAWQLAPKGLVPP